MNQQKLKTKPISRYEVAQACGVSTRQLTVWIARHPDLYQATKHKQLFTPAQVDEIERLIGGFDYD